MSVTQIAPFRDDFGDIDLYNVSFLIIVSF
jgi:hypothetical protein